VTSPSQAPRDVTQSLFFCVAIACNFRIFIVEVVIFFFLTALLLRHPLAVCLLDHHLANEVQINERVLIGSQYCCSILSLVVSSGILQRMMADILKHTVNSVSESVKLYIFLPTLHFENFQSYRKVE
jgi:hypothetical protein